MEKKKGNFVEDITTNHLRRHLGEIFDRVQYGGETYIVKRKGKEIGAIVPPQMLRALQAQRQEARSKLLRFLDERADVNQHLTEEETMDIALEAQEEARAKRAKSTRQ